MLIANAQAPVPGLSAPRPRRFRAGHQFTVVFTDIRSDQEVGRLDVTACVPTEVKDKLIRIYGSYLADECHAPVFVADEQGEQFVIRPAR